MQLVAYGAQDVYLTGNPQITFFKVVYRRHTNFAMEAIEQVFMGNVQCGKKTSATIARNGDLVGRMYLEIDLCLGSASDKHRKFVDRMGHALIDYVEIEIGGQTIDKHYGQWMDVWSQLTHSQEQFHHLSRMLGGAQDTNAPSRTDNLPTFTRNSVDDGNSSGLIATDKPGNVDGGFNDRLMKLYVPLQFWFNTNPGLALPLIALQYHEVKLNVMFKHSSALYIKDDSGSISQSDPELANVCLFCDYIFLDTDERRRFAQVSHEYLINQVQYNGKSVLASTENTANIDLRFNHPCKEIVWILQDTNRENSANNNVNYSPWNYNAKGDSTLGANTGDQVSKAVLQLNGHDRFREREGTYFRTVQPYQHHTGLFDNGQSNPGSGNGKQHNKGMFYMYSFALKPEEHQPSGSCNFSRIDNAVLTMNLSNSNEARSVKVYATNYNVLRIMSGMGGLAYSN